MINNRTSGQKLLPVAAKAEFISALDANLGKAGYSNRSQFVRDAIIEKMESAGVKISRELALAPPKSAAARRAVRIAVMKRARSVARRARRGKN